MAILAPSWPILATTCCQLGPSCVHLGSIFAPTSPKISTRSRQKSQEGSPETPKPPRRSPEGSRTAPGTRIFMVWGSISDLIFHFFLQSLLQFFWRLREWVTSNLRRLFIDLETFSPTSQSSNSSWPPCLKFGMVAALPFDIRSKFIIKVCLYIYKSHALLSSSKDRIAYKKHSSSSTVAL